MFAKLLTFLIIFGNFDVWAHPMGSNVDTMWVQKRAVDFENYGDDVQGN